MTLQASPPISILDIYNEFLAPVGTPITDFYRGGPYVPDVAQNANVPTSGHISLLNFLGAARYLPFTVNVAQSGGTIFQAEPAPAQRSVTGSLNASTSGGTGGTKTYNWTLISMGGSATGFSWGVSGPNGQVVTATAPCSKNVERDVEFQLSVSDGVTTITNNYLLRLLYETDA